MNTSELSLSELIHAVSAELWRTSFTEVIIARYNRIWDRLLLFADERKESEFSLRLGQDFLETEYGLLSEPKTDRMSTLRIRAIHLLETYQLHGILPVRMPTKGYVYVEEFREVFEDFIKWRRFLGVSEKTIKSNEIYLERFSNYLHNHGLKNISEMNVPVIHGFIGTLSAYKPPTIYCTLCCLRVLFRYLHDHGYTERDFSLSVPSMNYDSRSKIPSAYSKEEVNTIISQIDRGNPKGKRDYAIVLLAARLGLRASDICSLSFKNIRWENNTIEIIQEKTEELLTLPLLREVGEALIDYLKYGRPISDLPYVFLRHVAPLDKLNPPTLHSIVTFYMHRAGIPVSNAKKHGPHALRHSLAGILLEGNTPFPVISGILGHSSSKSTSVYVKVDVLQLKNCALEVPEFTAINVGKGGIGNE